MRLLRFTQDALDVDRYRVEVALEGDGPRRVAKAEVTFRLTEQDEEDLRWYLEDYLQWPHDPAPAIAGRVEQRIEQLGTWLFESIFEYNATTRRLWYAASEKLVETRVEVVTTVEQATSIPWELLREPGAEAPLALLAHSFVRAQPEARRGARTPAEEAGPVRILLAICRPDRDEDVPFRSVAARILKGLDETSRQAFDLDVLRPPTFEKLAQTLRAASVAGRPYHVLHFDGHGAHLEMAELFEQSEQAGEAAERLLRDAVDPSPTRFSPREIYPRTPRPGKHGYLVFENPGSEFNKRFVDGQELAGLLEETGVPVLVLNACRSAYAEAREQPDASSEPGEAEADDPHQTVRALGSLAQELMDSGVGGVVAMRYNVYVVTAARFVAELYASLARGQTLGAAVALGRKHLHDDPLREVVADPLPLQDWQVPIVYEAAPIALFPKPADGGKLEITLADASTAAAGSLDRNLPPDPDAGFWGRDETLLALDRAFDDQPIVLLHAYAGSGKTATAAEFARWYALTGGVEGPVLFTTFELYMPLPWVLDRFGEVFGPMLERSGVNWLAKNDGDRRQIALQVMEQVPVLWIWDNIEPVTGFPTGSESAWTDIEQRELADFLRACRKTKARFLLTSRRDEEAWLGDLPAPIQVPPMPMTERLQLARALAAKRGRRAEVMRDWRPLLEFSGGNPLTLTVLVGQALRDGLVGRAAVQEFVHRLRAGEAVFGDEAGEGRSRSLGASLGYGFEHAFNEDERRRLALLHLFQGFVTVSALKLMGHPKAPWCLPELRGLSRDEAVALLDRAAEVGLLTPHVQGCYYIHPALPWFFRGLFERFYDTTREALRAFVELMGELGNAYHSEYEAGNRDVIGLLQAEEANLLQAWRVARTHGWWGKVIGAMQGLDQLYDHTGRQVEWRRLVKEIVPEFIDPETEGPLPDRSDEWSFVNGYRVRLAREARRWNEAERLQQAHVDWERQRSAPILGLPRASLDSSQRNTVHHLAVSLLLMGVLRRKADREGFVEAFKESLHLEESIGNRTGAAVCALNLAHAYKDRATPRGLRQAERWYRRSLELRDERDRMGRSACLSGLGGVAFARFRESCGRKCSNEETLRRQREAESFYLQALEQTPADAVVDLGVTHGQLANIYSTLGETGNSMEHYRDAIRCLEKQGNEYDASQIRFNIAFFLDIIGRSQDALEYVRTALAGFERYGDSAADMIQKSRQLIETIQRKI